jgi:hypothetical protein
MGSGPTEDEEARRARLSLNQMMMGVSESFDLLGVPRTVRYLPPPMIGGYAVTLDLVGNMFELWRYQIQPQTVEDALNRAIGAYLQQERRLFWQMFNPFHWLDLLLGIPFRLLTAVGLNGRRFEQSAFGKLIKWVVAVAGFVAAVLDIRDHPNFIAQVSKIFHSIFKWGLR